MKPLTSFLREIFGDDFPVATGSAERDDPLIITEKIDYVSIEYVIAQALMEGQDYELKSQGVRQVNGRTIDELVYAVKEPEEEEWTLIRHFFFDITDGFEYLAVLIAQSEH
ncbi:MAG TPA: hypothetical protein VFD09_11495 [Thiopseudomonas sp.]|nr:hypothetical protein [Thiopseudomonas sp.]